MQNVFSFIGIAQFSKYQYQKFLEKIRIPLSCAFLTLVFMVGCSIIGDPSVHEDWGYTDFNQFETFANRPNARYYGSLSQQSCERCVPEEFRNQCTAKTDEPELTIAATRVRWDINSSCRNTYPAAADKAPPTRTQVVEACSPPNNTADNNFIALGISGGGTKSAVFATQAMFAMDQWGLLDEVDMVSSVSGGSFAAALYALSCDADENGELCDQRANARPRWPNWQTDNDPSCRGSADDNPLCVQWRASDDRAKANLMWPFFTRRFDVGDQFMRAMSHRTSSNVLADSIDWRILGRPDSMIAFPTSEGVFSSGSKEVLAEFSNPFTGPGLFWYAPGPDGVHKLRFRDLNPRRPNLVLNATNVSTDRQYLEVEAGLQPVEKLLTDKRDHTHFAFTDHYFEKVLHSDLASYPVANAVAASAAFPALVDFVTVGRFMKPGSYGNACGIDYLHLTDGGVLDNHGLTAIRLALEDVFGPAGSPKSPPKAPRRVLAVVLDSSLTPIDGLSRKDPLPLGLDAAVSPLRPFSIDRASALLIASNAAQHDARLRDYLKYHVRHACPEETGPTLKTDDARTTCASRLRIGFESMGGMDGYDGVLVGDRHLRCDDPEAIEYLKVDPLDPKDAAERARQRRQCAVMGVLRTPEAKARLGLGTYHPQCYLEAARSAATSYSIDDDMAVCLQHAARWAVAMKMGELCADRQFGGDPDLADRKKLPIGVQCPLPLRRLPPLPKECKYEAIVNTRPWTNMPRQTAHCACTDPYDCRPEDLLTGNHIDNGWNRTTTAAPKPSMPSEYATEPPQFLVDGAPLSRFINRR